jgi:hypothetical protein
MSAETKRREILQMLAKGSINAKEAGELLEQVVADKVADEPTASSTSEAPEQPAQSQAPEPVAVRTQVLSEISSGEVDTIVEVNDEQSGEQVQVFIS